MDYIKIYKDCFMIRAFEKTVEKKFELGKMRGTTHGCVGQEIIPVIVMEHINRETDHITGTHRCHGQVLAYTHDPYRLACEMMGRADGFNCGMGGSQHIKTENYITNGVTGGMAAVGAGMALSLKKRSTDGIVVSFLGDGGFQEGYVSETLSIASAFSAPIVYVLENNHYAMSTPTADYSAGTFESRVTALDIAFYHTSCGDIDSIESTVSSAIEYARKNRKPAFICVDTFRLCGHSKSDDMAYMTEDEKQENISSDPMTALEKKINDDAVISSIRAETDRLISKAFDDAEKCAQLSIEEYKQIISAK